jgi:fructose-1,6-bisphosphatase II
MLFNGERVGSGRGPQVDIAVDPLEGTELTALGEPNAIAVIAAAERDTMFFPGATAAFYMEKLAVGPEGANVIDLRRSASENVARVAEAKKKFVREMNVVVLNRPRHESLITELRDVGARVNLIPHGDTAPAIAAARERSGVDMVMGIGGTTEGVIAACALKALGGAFQGRFWPRDDTERQVLTEAGHDPDRTFSTNDLVRGDNVFVAATGVTTGALLHGVLSDNTGVTTDSLVMRSRSGTVRRISAEHSFDKLERFTGHAYR